MDTEPHRPDIARELIARQAEARAHRGRLVRCQLTNEEIGRARLTDHANAVVLQRITEEHGWPGWGLLGQAGATAAWQIALHADNRLAFQRRAARLMYQAVRLGQASCSQWAHLHDRCLVHYGAGQEYGTQYRLGSAGPERLAVNDPQSLDVRRAEVGLPPAAAALEALRIRLASAPALGAGHEDATAELVGAA